VITGLVAGGALALEACGDGPGWKGYFEGSESEAVTCSDGQTGSTSGASDLDIEINGSQIFWPTSCGVVLTANVGGNVATVVPTTCLPQTENGVTSTAQITGGTLTLDNDTVTEAIRATVSVDGGACTEALTGTFLRSTGAN
jgi:hypothetical protein